MRRDGKFNYYEGIGVAPADPTKVFRILVRRYPYTWKEKLILKPLWDKYYFRLKFKYEKA